jgi:hypothetical protein
VSFLITSNAVRIPGWTLLPCAPYPNQDIGFALHGTRIPAAPQHPYPPPCIAACTHRRYTRLHTGQEHSAGITREQYIAQVPFLSRNVAVLPSCKTLKAVAKLLQSCPCRSPSTAEYTASQAVFVLVFRQDASATQNSVEMTGFIAWSGLSSTDANIVLQFPTKETAVSVA